MASFEDQKKYEEEKHEGERHEKEESKEEESKQEESNQDESNDFTFHRDLNKQYPSVDDGIDTYLKIEGEDRYIFDASCGASVSVLGNTNPRIADAKDRVQRRLAYLAAAFWKNPVVDQCSEELIRGTGGKMARVFFSNSGSSATETAMKMGRQYFCEKEGEKKTKRSEFISRDRSYHGNTLGALSLSGFLTRKEIYKPLLADNVHFVSSCYPYVQREEGESDETFVSKKAAELEAKFQSIGPEKVIGFIAEPVVGAALGAVSYVPGYLKAMKEVCHKHGALFILDEIMSGMGKTGYLHAWQEEDVVPDIQTVAKALAAGYASISAVFISKKVLDVFQKGSGELVHGFTYEANPADVAACLETQRIIREENLLENVSKQGAYLEQRLYALFGNHPNVGDIRGKGLFWGLEFVQDKATKETFDPELKVSDRIHTLAVSSPYNLFVYPGAGSRDGIRGDHIIISPYYRITQEKIDEMLFSLSSVIFRVFLEIKEEERQRR